ncbi:conjugative transposon protein TraM [Mucilaginibacter terrae]|uniref:Conjugative transposon TraM C-terminal domain-containing protein n=1 Tax=Mucilaginibacter terrae TaxID=1955052 RepID=A0ABU3GWY7_9SPHI|nr:conjugative transposon protein TraM [Mucilaginibacter terrae]MDT3404274.1 hypothetical protein [Mucilaginibacter terrae]
MNIIIDSPSAAALPEAQKKRRKFYLALPILILPFMTIAFWALGGGKKEGQPDEVRNAPAGLNTTLPNASFKEEKKQDKLALYQQAARDSSSGSIVSSSFLAEMGGERSPQSVTNGIADPAAPNQADLQSAQIEQKIAQINRQIATQPASAPVHAVAREEDDRSIRKLRSMMNAAGEGKAADPEMQQISKVLSQLQAIQNPGTAVSGSSKAVTENAFQAISATIDGKQKVADGAAVRIKLTDSVTLRKQVMPKGQLLFGICQVTNQRLLVQVKNIRLGDKIIPVDLTVYSMDGMPGIPAPEAELAGAAGEGAENALANMQILSMDQSIGAQAATSGINAAKGLFNKKVKKIKVRLQDETPLLLRDNQQKTSL